MTSHSFASQTAFFTVAENPYNSQLNDEVKRFVQTFKDALKSAGADASSFKRLASEFLLRYRVQRLGTTGSSPSQLLIGRPPRANLNLRVRGQHESFKIRFNTSYKHRDFRFGQAVFSRSFFGRYHWKAGVILRRTGLVSYDVQVGNSVVYRHALQLRGRLLDMSHPSEEKEIDRDIQYAFDAAEENQHEQAAQPVLPVQQPPPPRPPTPQVPADVSPRQPPPLLRPPNRQVPVAVPPMQPSIRGQPESDSSASEKPFSPRRETRQAAAAAAAAPPSASKAVPPPAARALRPRENLHAHPRFADEYSKPGSGKT